MSGIAIRVENFSKIYPLYSHPSDRFKEALHPFGKKYHRDFFALKNVNFQVPKGEATGIVGKNGSGKSTLLKILSGVLTPSSGAFRVDGRLASLLELGTGFNPELTGIENVYFNASLLGLSKNETDAKLDDILAFADIGDFIRQPVKTYSSGMILRLAFAVISHVDAEVLVIDEALAVGDIFFVQKCVRFLRRFMAQGTLLFVSHDISAVKSLCKTALWLDGGILRMAGETQGVTKAYFESDLGGLGKAGAPAQAPRAISKNGPDLHPKDPGTKILFFGNLERSDSWKTGAACIESVRMLDAEGEPITVLAGGENVCLSIRACAGEKMHSPIIGFFVKDRLGQSLFGEHTFSDGGKVLDLEAGQACEAKFCFKFPLLPDGEYTATVSVAEGTLAHHVQHHWVHDAMIFKVSSDKLRYGLVGIAFESIKMEVLGSVEK